MTESSSSVLMSERGRAALDVPQAQGAFIRRVARDRYDVKSNPMGFIDFGVAQNRLTDDIVLPKDFGVSGYRNGVLHSRNKDILKLAVLGGLFSQTAAVAQLHLEQILNDTAWIDTVYIPTYRQRLRDNFRYVSQRLSEIGVRVFKSTGACFAWVDLTQFLRSPIFEEEEELQERFMDSKVFIVPSRCLYGCQPGWFRIVISAQREHLVVGMDRIERVLQDIKASSKNF